jgi:glucosamine-6-phosphate deaminase
MSYIQGMKRMRVEISATSTDCGTTAARKGASFIQQSVLEKGTATIILATGASQIEMLGALTSMEIDWSRVTAFHLDEYIGLPESHPASFRKYLRERFVEVVNPYRFHYINGEMDPKSECRRLGELIRMETVDVAFIGIGENGHLAFNDPPADFDTPDPYIVVQLDEVCRRQQLNEGWFPTLESVPKSAISMSVRQIMKSVNIVCTVPDLRKARAVKDALKGPVTPDLPASILNNHTSTWLYLDKNSSSLLGE